MPERNCSRRDTARAKRSFNSAVVVKAAARLGVRRDVAGQRGVPGGIRLAGFLEQLPQRQRRQLASAFPAGARQRGQPLRQRVRLAAQCFGENDRQRQHLDLTACKDIICILHPFT